MNLNKQNSVKARVNTVCKSGFCGFGLFSSGMILNFVFRHAEGRFVVLTVST